jgi:hypothetical protein
MVQSRSSRVRFLRRKQRLEPLPLRVCQLFSFHTDECTPPVRVCKHALAFGQSSSCHIQPSLAHRVPCGFSRVGLSRHATLPSLLPGLDEAGALQHSSLVRLSSPETQNSRLSKFNGGSRLRCVQ